MEHPVSSSNSYITQGPSKSHEFNKLISDIHTDIKNLFDINNNNEDAILKSLSIYAYENHYLSQKVEELKARIENVYSIMNNISNNDTIKTLYSPLSSILQSNVTHEFNTVTLPAANKINKLAMVSGDDIYIPDSLQIEISECTDGTSYNVLLDPDDSFIKGTYWTRTFRAPASSNIQKVYCKIKITVPLNINNNIYANVLKLIPYPRYGVTVDEIKYKNAAGTWNTLPYDGTLTVFNDVDIYELEVYISQTEFFADGNDIVFTYGLKELGLYYYDFMNTGSFVVPYSIKNTTGITFHSVKEPDEINGITYQLFTDAALTKEIWFDGDIFENNEELYLKVNMERKDTIPVLRGLKLNFYVRSAN